MSKTKKTLKKIKERLQSKSRIQDPASLFHALGTRLIVRILLACVGLMMLGVAVWVIFLDGYRPLPAEDWKGWGTKEVFLIFLAWLSLSALQEVGGWVAAREFEAWAGRPRRKILWNLALAAANVVIILLAVDAFGLELTGQNWSALGFRRVAWYWVPIGVGLGLAGMITGGVAAALVYRIQGVQPSTIQDDFITASDTTASAAEVVEAAPPPVTETGPRQFSWFNAGGMVFLVGVAIPFAEEVLFRGVLYQWMYGVLSQTGSPEFFIPVVAIPLSAFLFGVAHMRQGLAITVGATVAGLMLGLAFQLSHSLWVPILMHAINNSTKVILTYVFRT